MILSFLSFISIYFFNPYLIYIIPVQESESLKNIHSSNSEYHQTQWIKNPSFENSTDYWNTFLEGDSSDINIKTNECATFEILGESKTFSLECNPPSDLNWTETINPNFPNLPDLAQITDAGCRVSHKFNDTTAIQDPCVHWDQNLTLPINLSDYCIYSASIQAIVNATVDENLDRYYDYLYSRYARVDPYDRVDTYSIGDFVRFYVLISDIEKKNLYEIAYFQTQTIGSGNAPGKDYLSDTYMISVPEETLIFYLSSVLGNHHKKFTLTLGIRIHIEDNLAEYWDVDTFDELLIKNVNLTFNYVKNIDESSMELEQIGSSLIGNNVEIIGANLNFKYKIDSDWNKSLTSNSEMKVFINNYDRKLDINLNSMNASYQYLEVDGIDVTSFILKDINISLTIQILIADQFTLDRILTISVDDINLGISYVIYLEEPPPNPYLVVFLLVVALFIILSLGFLSFRAYVIIPAKKKKVASILLKTQKLKDIDNIQAIILMHKPSGLPIFSQNYTQILKGKDTLFSGFIQAISIIGEEISREESNKIKLIDSRLDAFQKVIELDLKQFHCLILDIEELRSVLILKNKSSKRLKEKLFQFTVGVYVKLSTYLKNWNNDLDQFNQNIPIMIKEHFDMHYKFNFKASLLIDDLSFIKKKFDLSRTEQHLIKQIQSLMEEKALFRLEEILDINKGKNIDSIIFALESLIEQKFIIPFNS